MHSLLVQGGRAYQDGVLQDRGGEDIRLPARVGGQTAQKVEVTPPKPRPPPRASTTPTEPPKDTRTRGLAIYGDIALGYGEQRQLPR